MLGNPLLDEFLASVASRPNSIAISSADFEISFLAMSSFVSDEIAILHAHKKAFSPDAPLPILVGTTPASYLTLLAALVGSISCAVLDKRNPVGRLASHLDLLSSQGKVFDSETKKIVTADTDRQPTTPHSSQLANLRDFRGIVTFSSGSTGAPKGILLDFPTIWWRHSLKSRSNAKADESVISAFSSPHQVAGINRLLRLIGGSRLHIVDLSSKSLRRSLQELREAQVTELNMPSQVARLVAENVSPWALNLPSVTSLKIGSEAAAFEVVYRLAEALPDDAVLTHGLGFTEGPAAFKFSERLDRLNGSGTLPIGRIHNPEFVRLSASPKFGNESFEVVVSGPIAQGYLEADLSGFGRFETNADGKREWRSGDLVKKIDLNNYEHVGRKDRMMKINGNFVMPSEIEKVAGLIPGVRRAVVVAKKTADGLKMVLWLESGSLSSLDTEVTASTLRGVLPRWIIPSRINFVPELPMLPGGKIDFQQLESWH